MRELGGIFALVSGIALLALYFRQWGYKAGFRDGAEKGFESGRKSEENWWLNADAEVDRERVKIWREET